MYHNKECFQKLTNMTKQFQKYALVHSQIHNSPNNQEYLHQDKKGKFNRKKVCEVRKQSALC